MKMVCYLLVVLIIVIVAVFADPRTELGSKKHLPGSSFCVTFY